MCQGFNKTNLPWSYQLLDQVQASRTSNELWSKFSDGSTCFKCNGWTSNCQCSLLPKKHPIIEIFCISRGFAIPTNPEKWISIVLQNHSFTVLFHVIWYIKYLLTNIHINCAWCIQSSHIKICVYTECEDEMYVHSKLTKTENVHIFVCILFDAVHTHIEKNNS